MTKEKDTPESVGKTGMVQAEYEKIEAVGSKDTQDVEEDEKASDISSSNLNIVENGNYKENQAEKEKATINEIPFFEVKNFEEIEMIE
ncbi:hypothetical protein AYI70_g6834 [Smittium culicis]|uniref:Uncharacterized protein n=1 Tax=Smittium culicis TaxID=133412 RepID=A0A1R1XN91_9FUNG|nr:hypothetical protein AYI70_g6834 [Smittium culicis]